jgi:nucleotide-binding universal stress UspA family protein
MFSKIIWATDGSESADHALPFAKALATGEGRSLVAVHINEHFAAGRGAGNPVLADEGDVETKIRDQVAQLQADGVEVSFHLVGGPAGHTGHALAEAARELGADTIVVGTRGHALIPGLLIGSVTQRLLHLAHCPVLAVPPGAHP